MVQKWAGCPTTRLAGMTATSATGQGAEYAATASEAYRAALAVIESVEPRIADATRKNLPINAIR